MGRLVFTVTVSTPGEGDFPATLSYTAETGEAGLVLLSAESVDIEQVIVTSQPALGWVRVKDNFDLVLQMAGVLTTGDIVFSLSVKEAGVLPVDCTVTVTISAPENILDRPLSGWGPGEHYRLEADATTNRMVVEPTANFRTIYCATDGYTREQIGDLEPSFSESDFAISEYLANGDYTTQYGFSPEEAVDADVAKFMWRGRVEVKTPAWKVDTAGKDNTALLFKRGQVFPTITLNQGSGFSPLHPHLIGAYDTGAKPQVNRAAYAANPVSNHVWQDVELINFTDNTAGDNIMFDHVVISKELKFNNSVQPFGRLTLRNSTAIDVIYHSTPPEFPTGFWNQNAARASGFYGAKMSAMLLEDNFMDHCGWVEGYAFNRDITKPQPPSQFSHNFYLAANSYDTTVRNNLLIAPASSGVQFRSSGFAYDNVTVRCGVHWSAAGGIVSEGSPGQDPQLGNQMLLLDNVMTEQAQWEDFEGVRGVDDSQGAADWPVTNNSLKSGLINNIICHRIDPNDAAQLVKWPFYGNQEVKDAIATPSVVDDTVVYSWTSLGTTGTPGVDRNVTVSSAVADATTIQLYTDSLKGGVGAPNDFYDFSAEMRTIVDYTAADTIAIGDYFRAGFDIAKPVPGALGVQTFTPDVRFDGSRFDNRLNWSGGFVPRDGDSLDLDGYSVGIFDTRAFPAVDLGAGGRLKVTGGKSVVASLSSGNDYGRIEVSYCGQIHLAGYSASNVLSIVATGGRFVNTAALAGAWDMTISGTTTEAILAVAGGSATVGVDRTMTITGSPKVGFDGAGGGVASLTVNGTLAFVASGGAVGKIREFVSGMNGVAAPNVASAVTLASGSTVTVDTTGLSGTYNLIDVASLTNNGASLPSGVAVVGNKLVLTV